jgi:EAL domain-containing protein (putative c-di-GMP-specific phosphodiesterase class I)
VARAIIELGHVLGIIAVAEGVETADTAEWLRQNGCDVAQGFFFSAPRTADEILDVAASVAGKPG